MEPANGQASTSWNGDYKVAHVGLFDFTGAFREKRLDAKAFDAAARDGWHFIDALPYWMHDETCFAEKGFVDEDVAIDAASLRPYPFEPNAVLAVADYSGPSAAISPRSVLKSVVEKAGGMGFTAIAGFEFETIFLAEDGASGPKASQVSGVPVVLLVETMPDTSPQPKADLSDDEMAPPRLPPT